jgi:hypothetical protein
MTDNKIQSATCSGRCGRCRLESRTRGKGVAVVERQWVRGSCPAVASCRGSRHGAGEALNSAATSVS